MKVLVVDEVRSRATELVERLRKERHDVTLCVMTNDLMNALRDRSAHALLIDLGTWHKGKAVYEYFEAARLFADTPVVVYNASEEFKELGNRRKLVKDVVLQKPSSTDAIVGSLAGIA